MKEKLSESIFDKISIDYIRNQVLKNAMEMMIPSLPGWIRASFDLVLFFRDRALVSGQCSSFDLPVPVCGSCCL